MLQTFEIFYEAVPGLESRKYTNEQGTTRWFTGGHLDREDGPAVEYANGRVGWYLFGQRFRTPEEWAASVLEWNNKPNDPAAVQEFLRPILAKQTKNLI